MSNLFTHGHALLIGVGGNDIPCTIDDATGLAGILQDAGRCAYPPDQVKVLTGAQATRSALLAALAQLAQETDAASTVLVYFSGHGYQVKASIGQVYYLIPHGYDVNQLSETAVSGQELAAALLAIPHQRLLLLLDCCHAGGLDNMTTPGLTFTKAPIPQPVIEQFGQGHGRVVIASSRADEKSFAGKPYSAFTLALIESLTGEGVAEKDGFVRVADIALHTREKVPQRTHNRQHPILNFTQADNFVLAYYASGDATPKGRPFAGEPVIEGEPGEIARSQTTYEATVHGSGTVVQGNNNQVATGGSVVIGGSVGGNVTLGSSGSQTER